MAHNLPQHICRTEGDDNGDVKSSPCATHFENLYNLTCYPIALVDGDRTKPPPPNKQHNIPSAPANAVSTGRSVDEYATHVCVNSTKTTYIDPCNLIDLLSRAFNDILPPVNACAPRLWTPRHDKTRKFRIEENEFPPATCIDT
jgi:hypothetical protein